MKIQYKKKVEFTNLAVIILDVENALNLITSILIKWFLTKIMKNGKLHTVLGSDHLRNGMGYDM